MLKGDVMKIQSKIYLYNFLTVVFALMTVISLGSLGQLPLYTVVSNVALFAMATYFCVNKENHYRAVIKNRRRHKKVQLSVYRGNGKQSAKVA